VTGPPDQEKAPRCVGAQRGAKVTDRQTIGTVGRYAAEVKAIASIGHAFGDAARNEPHASARGGSLPCLNSNKCNEPPLSGAQLQAFKRLSTNHKKTAFKLSGSVKRMCSKYGVERIGFLTLTFADHVTCAKEAGKRFHSLRTGVLACRYVESICVLERMKSGRIHFHLLVVMGSDIRTGFNFEQAARGVYSSANDNLRGEWSFWRGTARSYGFGRTELMPVKSNEEGLSKYVGKYIAKHVGAREGRDKGVRLVRYSSGASIGSNAFMFVSPRSKLWRWQVSEFARQNGCVDLSALRVKFGRRWAYYQRAEITDLEPPNDLGREGGMWFTWLETRAAAAREVAEHAGVEPFDAWRLLYQPEVYPVLSYDCPKFSGQSRPAQKVTLDSVTVWKDGRVQWAT
jgi:hypothetical protein